MLRFASISEFGQTLKKEGNELLAKRRSGRYANKSQWLLAAIVLVLFCLTYQIILSGLPNTWPYVLACIVGFFAYTVIATICHDAAHDSLSRYSWVNRLSLFLGFSLVGVSGRLWGYRHIRMHHPFPNVAGTDIDSDSTSLIRLTPHRPWRPWQRFQFLHAPLLYLFVLPHLTWIEDFKYFRSARCEDPKKFATASVTLEFAATKVIHVFLALILPIYLLDAAMFDFLIGYFFACAAASFMFVMINIGTHICDQATFVKPDKMATLVMIGQLIRH